MTDWEETEEAVACRHCGNRMLTARVRKYDGAWPWILIASGALFSLFIVGALVGIPVLLLGIYAATAREVVRHCDKCGYYYKALLRSGR